MRSITYQHKCAIWDLSLQAAILCCSVNDSNFKARGGLRCRVGIEELKWQLGEIFGLFRSRSCVARNTPGGMVGPRFLDSFVDKKHTVQCVPDKH